MKSSFALINDLVNFLDPLDTRWLVSGGWAIDIHLNRITRGRCDLDISIPFSDRLKCITFFLEVGWKIEGKLSGGFKTIQKVSDYNDDIHYFWSYPEGIDFVSEYVDDNGNRRIAYNRNSQNKLDYIEVFFDLIEDSYFVFRRDLRVKRREEKAILERGGAEVFSARTGTFIQIKFFVREKQPGFSRGRRFFKRGLVGLV